MRTIIVGLAAAGLLAGCSGDKAAPKPAEAKAAALQLSPTPATNAPNRAAIYAMDG